MIVTSYQLSVISYQPIVPNPQSLAATDLTIHLNLPSPISSLKSQVSSLYLHHNQNGLDISPTTWQQLLTLSKNILVPESEQSRLRGAGEQAG